MILFKVTYNKAGYGLGCGYLMIDKSPPQRVLGLSFSFNPDRGIAMHILSSSIISYKYGHF